MPGNQKTVSELNLGDLILPIFIRGTGLRVDGVFCGLYVSCTGVTKGENKCIA